MKKKRTGRKILIILIILIVVAQFFQPSQNKGAAAGPQDIAHLVQVPDNVMAVLKKSCYDCHSDSTIYPWYSYITPVNWWLDFHVTEGKLELNFTRFASYSSKKMHEKLEETAEVIEKDIMPLNSYLWIHKDAKMSDEQKKLVIDWARNAQRELPQQ